MHKILIKPRAIKMAQDVYNWYEERQSGLGELFLQELESCYDKLEAWPSAYTNIKKDFRHIILKTFPYVIIFKIIKDDVVIYAVFHTSRSPKKKFK
ncbi:type II toxin-antitoxin system RelE/ParE family toxin [Mucilaginibacter antarcticus]|uniref:Type II toxin-antitoxin system RelE/ParE family toxin n=1 Tax=Mucilaginibacter antarcticus TaxID=1855725 RepID=A0ABW5XMU7_9SPHI